MLDRQLLNVRCKKYQPRQILFKMKSSSTVEWLLIPFQKK